MQLKERKEITLQAVTRKTEPVIDILKLSIYSRLIRVTAWVFRVVTGSNLFTHTSLTVSELCKAKIWLSKQAQVQMFPNTMETLKKVEPLLLSNPLRPLNPFLDADGLLRVGGRLSQSQKDYQSRHPIILHGKHHLT